MRSTRRLWLLTGVAIAAFGPSAAWSQAGLTSNRPTPGPVFLGPQTPPVPPVVNTAPPDKPTRASAGRAITRGKTLPEGSVMNVIIGTTDVYNVAPYKLAATPFSTRTEVIDVDILKPPGEVVRELPDAFSLSAKDLGAAILVLNLIGPDGKVTEKRLEVLVIDEISSSYKHYLDATIRQAFPSAAVDVIVPTGNTAVLNGLVARPEQVSAIEALVRGFLLSRRGSNANATRAETQAQAGGRMMAAQPPNVNSNGGVTVINNLRIAGASQVQLNVVVAEVGRSKLRDLGFDWTWVDLSQPLTANLFNVMGPGLQGGAPSGNPPVGQGFTVTRAGTYQFNGFIRAVVSNQLGKILAQPSLTVISGQPAFFSSGGQVPVLSPQTGAGNQQNNNGPTALFTIEYRNIGTNLKVIPTVLGDGRVRLDVRPEVSERDDAFSVVVAGTVIPGFRTRLAETTVELEAGQTFAIAGLIQQRTTASTVKTPGLGDLPLVGMWFQSKTYRTEETELLFMVTPQLVEAVDERACKLPGRESRVPNDWEWYFGGKFEPPCFDDPYRNHWQKHFNDIAVPPPAADVIPDNYGRAPGLPPSRQTWTAPPVTAASEAGHHEGAGARVEAVETIDMVPEPPPSKAPAPETKPPAKSSGNPAKPVTETPAKGDWKSLPAGRGSAGIDIPPPSTARSVSATDRDLPASRRELNRAAAKTKAPTTDSDIVELTEEGWSPSWRPGEKKN